MKKKCNKCLEDLGFDDFYNDKRANDGKKTRCKKCVKEDIRRYLSSELGKSTRKQKSKRLNATPKGKAATAWRGIIRRTTNINLYPSYVGVRVKISRDDFMKWAIPAISKFVELNPSVRPSVDRIDSDGHYELSNLRIISQPENSARCGDIENRRLGRQVSCLLHESISQEEFVDELSDLIVDLCNKKGVDSLLLSQAISQT